jgi:pyridoxine 5-phosphate synthase
MTRLSVNINKVALIRNSRDLGLPNIVQFAKDCEKFGAEGITVHPRPDERHIRYQDVYDLKQTVTTELNVEGNPTEKFLDVVLDVVPHQATLVPDDPNQLTSDHGWDTVKHKSYLQDVIGKIKEKGIRVSIFVDPVIEMVEAAKETGTDCIELYTEPFASSFEQNKTEAVEAYVAAAIKADQLGLIINAGHDLNLKNLAFFKKSLVRLDEVSIGHALVTDALYYGIQNTIGMYKRLLK